METLPEYDNEGIGGDPVDEISCTATSDQSWQRQPTATKLQTSVSQFFHQHYWSTGPCWSIG